MQVPKFASVAVLIALACTACRGSTGQSSGAGTAVSGASESNTTGPGSAAVRVVDWGIDDGLLSIVVQNVSGRTIESARAVITARDAHHTIVAAVSDATEGPCCTVFGIPPQGVFGLYADFGPAVTRTRSVSVQTAQVRYAPGAALPGGSIQVTGTTFASAGNLATVSAMVRSQTAASDYIAVQAILDGPDGKLVAVISGQYYCLSAGKPLRVILQLFHPVPRGTYVEAVHAYPIPASATLATARLPSCTRSG